MSPSGPPVTTYCIRALALALGELLAFVEPLLGEVLGHLAVLPWSWCADHRAASSPVLPGVRPADGADLLALPVTATRSAPRFARVRDVTGGAAAEHVDRGVVGRDAERGVDGCRVPAPDGFRCRLVAAADGSQPQPFDAPTTAKERPGAGASD